MIAKVTHRRVERIGFVGDGPDGVDGLGGGGGPGGELDITFHERASA